MVGELGGSATDAPTVHGLRRRRRDRRLHQLFTGIGSRSGWLHDLSRRDPDAPPGVLELLVTTAVEQFRAEGAGNLHFGFTPFTSLEIANEVAGHSNLVTKAVRLLAEHGSAIYPAASQLAYKEKWALDQVQPEYVGFQGRVSIGALWSLLRLTIRSDMTPSTTTEPAAGRAALTRHRVIAVALQIIDREGLESLSMRRLGCALDRNAMAVYLYAADKDALLDAVLDLVLVDCVAAATELADAGRVGSMPYANRRWRFAGRPLPIPT